MPHRSRAPARIALPFVLPLAACANAPPALVVPESLLACRAAPAVPEVVDDPALARWVVDLAEAGEDCRARLAAVRGVVRP